MEKTYHLARDVSAISSVCMLLSGFADYHVHTPLCRHANGWPVEFAERAIELGLEELGFADHNPLPKYWDDWRMLQEELPRYIDSVEQARAEYPTLKIRLGLEVDYLAGAEGWWEELRSMRQWDYWIGSVHYLPDGIEVDHPKYINRYREGNPEQIWDIYWQTYEACIRSGWFEFVGHPDLPKKFGYIPTGDLRRYYDPVIQALVDCNMAYEINTAGWRKDCREQYPARQFVELACSAGVPMLINSDAHDPLELGNGFVEALQIARDAGYRETVRFEGGKKKMVQLPEVKR